MISVEKPGTPSELVHHGIKGMHWGVRRESASGGGGGGSKGGKGSAVRSKTKRIGTGLGKHVDNVLFEMGTQHAHEAIVNKASDRLVKSLPRIKAKHGEYGKLRNRARHPFSPEAKAYRADVKKSYLKHLETSANEITNMRGTRQYTLKEHGKPNTSQYFWEVSTQAVKHATDGTLTTKVRPIFDAEGWIIDIKRVEDNMAQTMELGLNSLIHMGFEV